MRKIIVSVAIVALFFGGTLWALNLFGPSRPPGGSGPALTALPPLQPITRTSQIIAPVAITHNAIRDAIDAAAPRNLTGKRDNPLSEALGKADIGWTVGRGPMTIGGRPPKSLAISTVLNGTLRITGQIANAAGGLTGTITGFLGSDIGRGVQNLTQRILDQRADIRGNVTVTSRPQLQSNWRIEPNLTGQVTVADGGVTIAGIKLNVGGEVKPMLDRAVNEQMTALQNRLRSDPTLEQTARREWAKMCRSISLGAARPGMPSLWLEMRPTRAFAAQPRIVPDWAILTVGVQAETRIVPSETKPTCPFPAQLDIVPPMDRGKVAIVVPIDMPFTELNKLLEAQLKGKSFPDDGSGPAEVTVKRVNLNASGDRLLISMQVNAKERKSWFGFGADATIHVWGKPSLDPSQQILRLTEITLDVNSEAAFGLLGAAARAAIPYVEAEIKEKAAVDLKPFAANARQNIEAAIATLQEQTPNVKIESEVTGLRLVGIEYNSTTLRVIAEAEGTARALVTKLQ